MRLGFLAACLIVCVAAVSSCSLPFYWQAASGQLQLLRSREPIDAVIADPATPAEVRDALAEIEQIRGVKSDRVIANLLEKGIIKEAGRKAGLGKSLLYGTTHEFLRLFGLTSLTDLPVLEEKGENNGV